jgi:hypothetical protein
MSLSQAQMKCLQDALGGRILAVCFGAGVDSTAMLVALHDAGLKPAVITFADTGGEKPETLNHLDRMQAVLRQWGWPAIDVCKKIPLASTGYSDLLGNCVANETLPSLAFGMKSCSIKWKQIPQDQFLKGCKSGPNACPPHPAWLQAQQAGERIVKLIGYDCGKADTRRSKNAMMVDADFDYAYPLRLLGWEREDCVQAITDAIGEEMVPVKSACFYCPASKSWELFWLAAHHPDLLEEAMAVERRALTGRHSRFDSVEFGAGWADLVKSGSRFPSSTTTVGLGRSFAWNAWARANDVADEDFIVRRDEASRSRFLAMSRQLQNPDNALDVRSSNAAPAESMEIA